MTTRYQPRMRSFYLSDNIELRVSLKGLSILSVGICDKVTHVDTASFAVIVAVNSLEEGTSNQCLQNLDPMANTPLVMCSSVNVHGSRGTIIAQE